MYLAGIVVQWITRLTTDQKIRGPNPSKLVLFLFSPTDLLFTKLFKSWILELLFFSMYIVTKMIVSLFVYCKILIFSEDFSLMCCIQPGLWRNG